MSAGVDYGMGQTNVDRTTGIRYGVIHHGEVGQSWYDSAESYYGEPHCPKCGNEAYANGSQELDDAIDASDNGSDVWVEGKDYGRDFTCVPCRYAFWSDEAYGDEPIAHEFSDDDYCAHQSGNDCDIFVTRSPYYTYAPFCSPCAPGAGYLGSADGKDDTTGVKTYCFGHDWFEDGKAPYRVFSVETGAEVFPNA